MCRQLLTLIYQIVGFYTPPPGIRQLVLATKILDAKINGDLRLHVMQYTSKSPPFGRKILLNFMFAISRKHARKDIQVRMFPFDNEYPVAFSKMDQALDLISRFDPGRYCQIKTNVKRIWIAVVPGYLAEWVNEVQTCIIDRNYLLQPDVTINDVAQTIVHEATHAHLYKLEIGYTEDIRHRVERLCVESEIAFARRLPDNQNAVETAHSRLQIPPTYWTNVEFQKRNLNAFAELGKKSPFARFLFPFVKRIVNRRTAGGSPKEKN